MLSCPYSLTLFGGVQGQVLGLARALRELGRRRPHRRPVRRPAARARHHHRRAEHPGAEQRLGRARSPAAGPWPAAPSRRCARSSPTCSTCTSRSRRVPTTPRWSAPRSRRSAPSTPRAPGSNGWYETFRPGLRPMMRRLAVSTAVSEDARRQVTQTFGGDCEILPNGVDVARPRHGSGHPGAGAGDRVRRPARAPQGTRGAARRVRRPRTRRRPLGGGRRPAPGAAPRPRGRRGSSGSGGSPRRRSRPACGARPSRASRRSTASRSGWCCSRRWPRAPRWWRPTSTATAPCRGPTAKRCSCRRATPTPCGRRCARCSTTRPAAPTLVAEGRQRADEFSMTHLAERFLPLYERAMAAPRTPVG